MKAFWVRIFLWNFLTFLGVSLCFFGTAYLIASRTPSRLPISERVEERPRTGRQGTLEAAQTIVVSGNLLVLYSVTMGAAFAVTGWLVVRKTFTPIVSLNDQLDAIAPNNFQVQIRIETDEREFRELQEHINGLLSRISLTFHQLQSYSAQVAHELRAPLTIIRLKIEEAADKIEPSLAEEIQTELLRLTMHVEQALLIARAEQGHLRPNRIRFNLAALLDDVVQDFRLLARDQDRQIEVIAQESIISADPAYMKQILYSLLTNSLRHGRGTIYAHLRAEPQEAALSIKNRVRVEDSDETLDLGLGRRIVAALVSLQQNMEVHTERKEGWYEVRLSISGDAPGEQQIAVNETTNPEMGTSLAP
jgi:signal transduction histidine kinase